MLGVAVNNATLITVGLVVWIAVGVVWLVKAFR